MTITPSSATPIVTLIVVAVISTSPVLVVLVNCLGSASTIAVSYGSGTVCGILAGEPSQRIQCYRGSKTISIQPNFSFQAISGGRSFFCGLRSGGFTLLCWDTAFSNTSFSAKRIYYSATVQLTDLTVGDNQVCAVELNTGVVKCWRGDRGSSPFPSPEVASRFRTITSGGGFSCGILNSNSRVLCWGRSVVGGEIQREFGNLSMSSLVAGESHVCGLTKTGILICKGNNESGQLDVPNSYNWDFEYSGVALGAKHSCAIRRRNGLVICWGGLEFSSTSDHNVTENVSFESIVAGLDFTCGLTSRNLSVICWGPGWSNDINSGSHELPLAMMIPGPCVQASCSICGVYPNSELLCAGSGNICKSCNEMELPMPVPLPPIPSPPLSSPSIARNKLLLAFVIVGSVGAFAGICTIIYFLWTGVWGLLQRKTHNSVQFSINTGADMNTASAAYNAAINALPSRSSSIKRQASGTLGRQRSGPSSRVDRAEEFSLSELAAATKNFSLENRIGGGSFGTVYSGTLADGREVAIKRGERTGPRMKKLIQEKESAFDSELALLSRLHHKHLVGLVGFCHEKNERLLVYEYMSNGALHDHLHSKNTSEKSSSILNTWKMRIKIALGAARGIEYLHNYAVPPIIHRDIKSSNILLDANWTAQVSDFGLSLMGPQSDEEYMPSKAVGTVGYIDPEYYVLNVLTSKSDVYGLGVVLLELLTGKRAVFKDEEEGTGPMGVVEYAGPWISVGEVGRVLDTRVGLPEMNEVEAVELMAYTAMHCVNLEGKERPTMTDIVANLERALALCEGSHGSISTTTFSYIPSE